MNVNNYKSIFQFMMVHPYLKDYLLQNSIVHIWVTYVYTYDIDCWYIRSLIQIPMLDILGRNVYSFSPYITSNCSQLLESPTQFAFRWWLAMLHNKSTHNLETPIYGVPHLLWLNRVGVAWSYSTNKILYASSVGEGMVENCGPQFTPTFHTK